MIETEFANVTEMAVDDEEFARGLIVRVPQNLWNDTVMGTVRAVDAMAKREAADWTVELVISNIEMPEINGYEFVGIARIHTTNGLADKSPEAENLKDHIHRAVSGA